MHDLVIKNGSIVDGSGEKPFKGDVAVKDGRIAEVSARIDGEAGRVIEAAGKVVTPGFIDIHRHCDTAIFKPGFGEIELRQGITTVISGNCGLSVAPCPPNRRKEIMQYLRPIMGTMPDGIHAESFSEYLDSAEKQKLPLNFGSYVGSGTLRMAVSGFEKRELENKDYALIRHYLNDAIKAGAFGVSLGLAYMPECQYNPKTLSRALEPIRGSNIPIVAHIRGEGAILISSLKEVIDIACILDVPLHISHFKAVGRPNWKYLIHKAIELLESAKGEGLRITCDVYPWEAGSTQMIQLLPPEYLEGGTDQTVRRLQDPELRKQCREIMSSPQSRYENYLYMIGWENIMVTSVQSADNQQYVGMRVSDIAEAKGSDPYTCAFDLLIEEDCNVSIVNFIACEDDIRTILLHHGSFIISDSLYADSGMPHPRLSGTFGKILAEYVREQKILSIEKAIHKFTAGPALAMGITGKGLLKKGFDADIAVFDPDAVQNNASYTSPASLGTGFSHVFVDGIPANENDCFINCGAGKVLRMQDRV